MSDRYIAAAQETPLFRRKLMDVDMLIELHNVPWSDLRHEYFPAQRAKLHMETVPNLVLLQIDYFRHKITAFRADVLCRRCQCLQTYGLGKT